ncbi:hypothetical protein E1091_01310 [Micromonospora fluostatini]|uniref:Uncharacterized protein n=1 Tax=Micromonospora fluostatini TaxID=1629071 RepID=A0ABY2DLM8_9ACTN|nr:hypothetical protein E1091_01310 [Micromonospora fluostatini]
MTTVFIAATPARDAVAAGARLMDQLDKEARHHGELVADWPHEVNPDIFDVNDPHRCALGQRYGTFKDAPIFADLMRLGSWLYGKDVRHLSKILGFWALPTPGEEDDIDDPGNSEQLNTRWREEIALRRALANPAWALAA